MGYRVEIKQFRTGWLVFDFEYRSERENFLKALNNDRANVDNPNEIKIYELSEED